MKKNSYSYDELINCGNGQLFGSGNAKLPLPPMLMFDRITEINDKSGSFKKGSLKAAKPRFPKEKGETYDLVTAEPNPESMEEAPKLDIPLKRVGEPQDIPNLCLFLASNKASCLWLDTVKSFFH